MYGYDDYAIGADIGGSHITAAAVDLTSGSVMDDTCVTTPIDNKAGAGEIIEKWGSTLQKVIDIKGEDRLRGVGLAMPGPFDYKNGIALFESDTQKYESLYGFHVGDALQEYLKLTRMVPVRFINDATAFAIGEEWIGESKGTTRSLAITLGTGIGSGFIGNSLPVYASPDVPENGYIYNLPYLEGIADDYFSTRGLRSAYSRLKGKSIEGVKEIAAIAEKDGEVLMMMQNFGKELGGFLVPVLQKFKPQLVVVGGNISKAFHQFGGPMQQEIIDRGLQIKVTKSQLCDTAQIAGAARIIDAEYFSSLSAIS